MVDDPEEVLRREARAKQIRAQIRDLTSSDHASDGADRPEHAPADPATPEAAPRSPREFIARKMRSRDDTDR